MKYFVCILAGNDYTIYLRGFDPNTGKSLWGNRDEARPYDTITTAFHALGNCNESSSFVYGEKSDT